MMDISELDGTSINEKTNNISSIYRTNGDSLSNYKFNQFITSYLLISK